MKVGHRPSGHARREYVLTLETEAERELSDGQLITLCDEIHYSAAIKYNPTTQSYDLTGGAIGPVYHFGGRVKRDGDKVDVTVYID